MSAYKENLLLKKFYIVMKIKRERSSRIGDGTEES